MRSAYPTVDHASVKECRVRGCEELCDVGRARCPAHHQEALDRAARECTRCGCHADRAPGRAFCLAHLEAHRAYQQARRAELVAKGLCVGGCGERAAHGSVWCEAHRRERAEQQARRYARRKAGG